MPIFGINTVHKSTSKTNISCLHHSLHCNVGWLSDCYHQCPTSWRININISISLCEWNRDESANCNTICVIFRGQLICFVANILLTFWAGIGLLCLSTDCFSTYNCNITFYLAGYTLARFDLVGTGLPVGNKSVIYICGSICEKRKEIACFVSSVLFLFATGVVDSIVLTLSTGFGTVTSNTGE